MPWKQVIHDLPLESFAVPRPVEFMHEDELPPCVDTPLFDAAYGASRIIDGVRMYPFIEIEGGRFLLVRLAP